MAHHRQVLYLSCFCLLLGSMLAGYFLWRRYYVAPFSCRVSFVQHHQDTTLVLWMNYIVDGKSGTLSINGHVQGEPGRIINRKISFLVTRRGSAYYLISEHNIKFPDDSVPDSWLEKYEPLFFVYPAKNIYMRIHELQNGSYLFILGSLPTYVCSSAVSPAAER
ncbi:hypothetical protein [Raoultella terrigena]|uniref:hypothetical protein n=1 Tax=Raoultella terrigena TaxID=577 RepID=UPI00132F6E31|nr:hypothetical protein [Raoultella terrigena]